MTDVMEWGFKPEKNAETGSGFEPFKGTYIARLDRLERKQGTSEKSGKEYDFYSITAQVVSRIKGEEVGKRLLFHSYDPDARGIKKLADDMFTAGIDLDTTNEETFEASFANAIDELITVNTWKAKKMKKDGENWIPAEPVEYIQKWNIPRKQEDSSAIEDKSDMPF